MGVVNVILGFALLTMGRKLFWLFVGVVGFSLGFYLTPRLLPVQNDGAVLLLGLVFGLSGALLAHFLQRLAVGLAGFIIGGYLLVTLSHWFDLDLGYLSMILFLIGGVVGAALVALIFKWALIILSAVTGSILVVEVVPVAPLERLLLFAVLLLLGILIQARLLRSKR